MAKKKQSDQSLEISSMSLAQLKKELVEAKKEWFKLKLDLKTGKLKDVHLPKKKRRQIARIKTIIREKELTS